MTIRLMVLSCLVAGFAACSRSASPTAPSALDTASVGSGSAAETGATATTMSTAAPDSAAANYEVKFMTGMIDHHQMAVEMAELCLARATHAELRQLCESIIAAQSREIQQMQDWLRNWYGLSYSPQMSNSMQKQMDQLASATGADFEIMFMEMMIRHHQAAIKEGRTCLERAYHRPLIRLCENIIATQSAEIEQMEQWLCEWYGRCG